MTNQKIRERSMFNDIQPTPGGFMLLYIMCTIASPKVSTISQYLAYPWRIHVVVYHVYYSLTKGGHHQPIFSLPQEDLCCCISCVLQPHQRWAPPANIQPTSGEFLLLYIMCIIASPKVGTISQYLVYPRRIHVALYHVYYGLTKGGHHQPKNYIAVTKAEHHQPIFSLPQENSCCCKSCVL